MQSLKSNKILTMKRITLIYIFLSFFCYAIKAQISTEERPYSWDKGIDRMTMQSIPMVTLPFLDMEAIQKEDGNNEGSNVTVPFRFGFAHEVNLSLSNSGIWKTTSDGGRLWTLRLYSPDALSLNLLYDKFWLPDGAKFFIYSEDMKQHIGAFTSQNNKGDKKNILGFATGLLFTNNIVLEYYEPAGVNDNGVISIVQVISGYRHIYDIVGSENPSRHNNTAYSCHNDINCPEGSNWQKEKNAVAYMVMGGYICTGSLLNTTANDKRPVFLSADHCFNTSASTSQWVFYWNYEATTCGGSVANPASNKSTTGANLLARTANTDFMLLDLIENPATNSNVTLYYLGWDRTSSSASSGVCIHHPNGAQKKISITSNAINSYPNSITWVDGSGNVVSTTPANTHWLVSFTNGTTEGGSSGSPLFNQNKRVIGQLHGGGSGCPPVTKYYGRFDLSWTGGGTNSTRLSNWLDPNSTGVTLLDGCGPVVDFISQSVTSNQTVENSCGDINVQNVTVTSTAKLTLDAAGITTIVSDFDLALGSELEIK